MSNRVAEMKQRLGVDDNEAVSREIERNDDAHARSVQRQFHADWQDATGYDIVVNTAFVAIEPATAVLQQLAKSGYYEATDESRSKLFDKLIEARVQTTLDAAIVDSPIGSGLGVTAHRGHVVIDGVVSAGGIPHDILDRVRELDGVRSVTDDTVSLPVSHGV